MRLGKRINPALQANERPVLEGAVDEAITPRIASPQQFAELAFIEDPIAKRACGYLLR